MNSLHERINVSTPNTRTGIYCFLIGCITSVARSDALFWAPSEAYVCLRAKTSYLSFDVRVLLNVLQQLPPVRHCVTQTLWPLHLTLVASQAA
jgi:hypothetical protein